MMNFRRVVLIVLWPLFLLSLSIQPACSASAAEISARVHWLGLKQISADTNSAHFMSVWQLPQTTVLVSQTFDKLSRWPGGGATNAASALLRPLLDDLVSSEFHLEIYVPTNSRSTIHDSRFLLAVRLSADRARLWQTNLAAAVETLTGVRPVTAENSWWLQQSHAPERIEFFKVGQWTLISFGQDTNDDLLPEFADRITRSDTPAATTNCWLETDLAPSLFADDFSTRRNRREDQDEAAVFSTVNYLLSTINHLKLTVTGDAGDVLTRGTVELSRPLPAPLPAWEIPTNFIHSPLTTFTAVRGLTSWLAGLPAWQKLQLAPPPDQIFFWAQSDVPFQTYFAAPLPTASNQVWQLAGHLMQNANPWLTTNAEGNFQWQTNLPGLVWKGAAFLSPFLEPVIVNRQDYVLGGLCPPAAGDFSPPPAEDLRAVLGITNLVYFQSEQTGQRIQDGQFIFQLFRVVLQKPQLPARRRHFMVEKYRAVAGRQHHRCDPNRRATTRLHPSFYRWLYRAGIAPVRRLAGIPAISSRLAHLPRPSG